MPDDVRVEPFTILIDNREQMPWTFSGITEPRKPTKRNPIPRTQVLVRTLQATLKTGDYTIQGCEDVLAIERKSTADLIGTLTAGRERFENELERMRQIKHAFVIVEGALGDLLLNMPDHTTVSPQTIQMSVVSLCVRFPGVQWFFCDEAKSRSNGTEIGARFHAERTAFRIMQTFWKYKTTGKYPVGAALD